ncbi:MAG: TonB-dependent receptor plug domain-containing protein [Pseudomonadota bacterium]
MVLRIRCIGRLGAPLAFFAGAFLNGPMVTGGSAVAQEAVREFTIPGGSLQTALNAYGLQSGVGVVYDVATVEGRSTAGIAGSLGTSEALIRLLAGTGLVARTADGGSVVIEAADLIAGGGDDGAIVMDQILVTSELLIRTLQDTQTSVAVVTGEELDVRGDLDLYDIVERIPDVTQAFGEKGFAIRGIDRRGLGSGGTGRLVTSTVDGVSLPNNQGTFLGP